jgi:hypothetical protein
VPTVEVIEVIPTETVGKTILVKISHYEPAKGGVNCARFVDGECVSKMSSGLRWQDYMDYAIACPSELEFGTKLIIDGRIWECLDRGGKIVFDGEYYWIDQLTENPKYSFGEIREATIIQP